MAAVTAKARIPYDEALALAGEVVELLQVACDRIEIAGSLRRKMQFIGDVEIVAAPRFEEERSLFAELPTRTNALDELVGQLVADGTLAKRLDANERPRFGSKLKYLSYRGFAVDLFAVIPPAQWGVIFAIRTGPADYSHQFVTTQGQSFRDFEGFRRGGLLPKGLRVHEGQLLVVDDVERLIPTPEETDFFAAIGVDYAQPSTRR